MRRQALLGRHRERAQLAVVDQRLRGAGFGEGKVDVAGGDVQDRLRAAAVGHVVEFQAEALRHLLDREGRHADAGGRAVAQRRRLLLGVLMNSGADFTGSAGLTTRMNGDVR